MSEEEQKDKPAHIILLGNSSLVGLRGDLGMAKFLDEHPEIIVLTEEQAKERKIDITGMTKISKREPIMISNYYSPRFELPDVYIRDNFQKTKHKMRKRNTDFKQRLKERLKNRGKGK